MSKTHSNQGKLVHVSTWKEHCRNIICAKPMLTLGFWLVPSKLEHLWYLVAKTGADYGFWWKCQNPSWVRVFGLFHQSWNIYGTWWPKPLLTMGFDENVKTRPECGFLACSIKVGTFMVLGGQNPCWLWVLVKMSKPVLSVGFWLVPSKLEHLWYLVAKTRADYGFWWKCPNPSWVWVFGLFHQSWTICGTWWPNPVLTMGFGQVVKTLPHCGFWACSIKVGTLMVLGGQNPCSLWVWVKFSRPVLTVGFGLVPSQLEHKWYVVAKTHADYGFWSSCQNPSWQWVLDWMCQQQGSLHLRRHIIKICPLAVEWMTMWTLDNFLRWFWIWNELQSEEMRPTPEILNSRQPTDSKLNQLAPPSKFVHYLSMDWLHGLCSSFYADSESVGSSKVKKFTWNHMLCWEPTSGRGLHHCPSLSTFIIDPFHWLFHWSYTSFYAYSESAGVLNPRERTMK